MTRDEALQRANELKGHLGDSDALSAYRREIEELSVAVLGHGVRKCSCRDRFSDALIEILNYLKHNKTMMQDRKCVLRRGVLIRHGGKLYTSVTITDDVAVEYLNEHPEDAKWFDRLPDTAQDSAGGTETAAEAAESEAVDNDADEVKKARKTHKKRKK